MSVLTATPTGTWALDPVHSTIGFELPYLAGTFRGQFKEVDAQLTDESLTGSARVASVDVKDENLVAHLQSPEFFDGERYPELSFESRELERSGEAVTVRGEITIRGITKPVELTGSIAALRDAVAEADALLFATPEYNSSVPGQLKNAVDWVSRPLATNALRNKPVLVVGASTGAFGAVWSQAELRKILGATGARVVDAEVAVGHAPTRFDAGGTLLDEDMRDQLGEAVDALVAETPAGYLALAV